MALTEGPAATGGIPRSSIEKKEQIPDIVAFLNRNTLEFLQLLFKYRTDFRYDPDDTKTKIQISDLHAVDLKTVGVRPLIFATRGPLSWQGTGLGGNAVESRNLRTGSYTLNDMLTGSVALGCVSREGVEANRIASLVFSSFKFFSPVLRKTGFFTIKSLNIGPEALIEQEGSDDKTSIVSVYVTAMMQDRFRLEETAARRLEKIILETIVNA